MKPALSVGGVLFNCLLTLPLNRLISMITGRHLSYSLSDPQELAHTNGTPLQYSCLENPVDRGAWWAAIHGVAKSQTRLSNFTFTFHFHALEKEMATHSSTLAWKIPWTEERGRLQALGSQRVGHN